MKVIHVPFCFMPDPCGGTEVYVATLAQDLQRSGVDVLVVASGRTNCGYKINGLRVRRFACGPVNDLAELYGAGDSQAAAEFSNILEEEAPDLVHLHAFTRAVSLRVIGACKSRNIPVVFTYHTPTVSCQRGTLMLWGETSCDGRLDKNRCAACALHGLGIQRRLAKILVRLPNWIGHELERQQRQGGIWTALRMGELISMRQDNFLRMAREVDHLVAVCDWARAVLLINNIPADKLSVSRHGIEWTCDQTSEAITALACDASEDVRIAFVGRLDPTKGLHVLIRALRKAPMLKIKLDIYGITQGQAGSFYEKEILSLAHPDQRISFRDPIVPSEVVHRLRRYDFLAVPSQWMETGPLVVLEAFAAGIPVIASRLGGPAELVHHEVDGLLVEPGAIDQWGKALRRVATDAKLRARLKAGVHPPRRNAEVTRDMIHLYRTLLAKMPQITPAA